jgi:DNA-binding CsgD family transcriptional regulator
MRRWSEADVFGSTAIRIALENRDAHAYQLCAALRLRGLAQQRRLVEALELEVPAVRGALPAARAGLIGSRALVLAAMGRVEAARELLAEVRGLSKAIEPSVLIAAVDAVCALSDHDDDALELVVGLEGAAFRRGAPDLLVTTYRAAPELLGVLLKSSAEPERLASLIRRVGDEDIAAAVGGRPLFAADDPRTTLTPREREVYELLIQRLTNREIAQLLFIEESTVKVHVHHIYDKLGTRSRLALTVQATLEKSGQATSATGTPPSATSPSDTSS